MSTRRALALSALDRYAGLGLGMLSTVVLARLLTPAQVGVYAVAMGFLALLNTVRDLGAGRYLLRDSELSIETLRAIWALLLGLGVFLGAVVLLAAQPAAAFFRQPALFDIFTVMAVNYLVMPFGGMTYAWLTREMRFDALALMRLASAFTNAAVAIGLAWAGWGAISLAWANLAGTLAQASVGLFYRPAHFPWRPGWTDVPRVLSYGGQVTASSAIGTLTVNLPEMLLARMQSAVAAGFYSRANGVLQLFHRIVTDAALAVAGPLFARKVRDGESLGEVFRRTVAYTTVLAWTFALGLALLAHPVVTLLYGDQWGASVKVLQWLTLGFFLGPLATYAASVLMAFNQVALTLRLAVISLLATALGAAIGTTYGLEGTAVGVVLANNAAGWLWLHHALQLSGLRWRQLLPDLTRCGAVALCSNVPIMAAVLYFGLRPQGPVLPLLVGGLPAALLLACLLFVFKHPLADELRPLLARLPWTKQSPS